MTTQRPAVLFVRVPAVPAAIDKAWNEWYDRNHIGYRMDKPQFHSARRYLVPSGPARCFVIYEMTSIDAMLTPEYLELRRWEGARPADAFEHVGPNLPGFERGIYELIQGPAWPDAAIASPAVYIAGHDPNPTDDQAYNDWCDTEHAPAMARVPGVAAMRRFKQAPAELTANSGKRTPRPRYFASYYLKDASVAADPAFTSAVGTAWARWQPPTTERYALLGTCIYSVTAKAPAKAAP